MKQFYSLLQAGKFPPKRNSGVFTLSLLFLALFPFWVKAGTLTMSNGAVITSCSDNFYDSGGPSSNYADNENKTFTIYPSTPGSKVTVSFSSFYLEDYYDYLYIYNGSSTSASMIGSYTSTYGPGTITSTAADGSLTFQFISDAYVNTSGWSATVSCSSLSACSGSITAGTALASITTACPGVPVVFSLSGFTAASGITYQWDTSATGTGGWGAYGGATTVPFIFTPPPGKTYYYRCRTTCTSSGSTSTSTTVSVAVSGSSLPYLETFESTSTGTFPPCTGVTYSGYYDGFYVHSGSTKPSWYPSVLANHTTGGSKFLMAGYYLGMVDYTPDYFFTPGFALKTGKTYQFSYWYVADGYGPYTIGAYMGNGQTKGAMTTAIGPTMTTNTTSYQQYVTNFTVPADGVYTLGLLNSQSTWYYGMAFDDIELKELPPCTGTPSYAGKANVSPKMICSSPGSATLSVTGTPPVSGLTFQWYEGNSLAGPFTVITGATTSPYTRTGLTSSKFFFCKVGCSAGGSTVNTDTVQMKIAPLDPPYIEDFESGTHGVNMPCASYTYSWDGYSYWYLYDGAHPYSWIYLDNHTPGGSKWLFAGGGLGYYSGGEYWFTPAINFTAGKAYDFSYWYKTDGYDSYIFGAALGNSQSASAMTTPIGSDLTTSTTTYTKFTGSFVAGSTGPQYIGIKFKASNWYYGASIDDIGLSQLPPCSAKPTAGTAKATPGMICVAGSSGTTLSLSGLSAASDLTYQWQQSTAGGAPGTFSNIAGATTPSYTTGAISVATCFRCVVKCPLISGTNTDTSAPVCVPIAPLTPPYIETFESATPGFNQPCASYTYSWDASPGTSNYTGWGIKGSPSTYYPSVDNHTSGGSKYLSAGYYISSYWLGSSSADQQYWFSPGIALTADMSYKMTYWYVTSGYSYLPATTFGMYYGTSQTASAMNAICPDIAGETNTTYKQMTGTFVAPTTGTYYLGVKVSNGYGYYGTAVDDIGLEQLPLCNAKPSAGKVIASPTLICSSGTAKLSLIGSTAASKLKYQWLVSSSGTAAGPYVPVSTGSGGSSSVYTTATLSSTQYYRCTVWCPLAADTTRDTTAVYVMNVGAIIPPYVETFEASTPGVNVPCAGATNWADYYITTAAGTVSTYGFTDLINHTPGGSKWLRGSYGATLYSGAKDFWFTPAIKLTAGATYEFSYWYLPDGYPYSGVSNETGLYVGTSQSRAAMTTNLIPDFAPSNTVYQQVTATYSPTTTGNYYFGIYLKGNYGYGIAIDDIGLMQLPPCAGKPSSGGVASAIPVMLCSPGSAKLNLTATPKVANLSYQWYTCDAAGNLLTAAGTASSSPALTLTVSATTYFRCIVKCTLGAATDTTYSSIVKLDVGAVTPPYIETFESGTPGVNMPCASYTYGFGGYYYWNVQGSPMTYGLSALDNHTTGGSKYLIAGYALNYSSGSPEFWFTPAIKFTGGKLYQLSYWYNTDGTVGANYGLATFMGTAQTKAAMTIALGSPFTTSTTSYKQFKLQFTPTTSGNFYVGFRQSQTGWGYGMAIDDIGIQEVPPCSAPVTAGTLFADPSHVCAVGGTTVLDATGSTLATGLTYEWLTAPAASGPWSSTGATTLPYTTDPLFAATWFKLVITCTATGATDTSAAIRVGVGGMDLPYSEDFESTSVGGKPLCSDATTWADYYNGWKVHGATIDGDYKNHTPGGKKFLIGGYYLGSPSSPSEDNYWFTPGFNIRGGYKYNLSFYYVNKSSWSSSGAKMGVYYGKSQSVGGMTTNVIPYRTFSNTTYAQYDTNFLIPTGGVYYFGFRKSGSNPTSDYSYYGTAIDDINLNYAPCDAPPVAGNIISDKPSGTQYCKGTRLKLTDIGATISLVPGIKYQWQRRDLAAPAGWASIVGATDTVLSADTLIGYDYRMMVVCSKTNDTVYTPVFSVPQFPPHPAVNINPSTTPIVFCLGDTVHFTATNYAGALYDWMRDSVVVPGWKFSDMGATDPGTYMVKVTSSASPCPAYSNKVKLVANDPGYSVVITKPADSIICAGSSLTLTGTGSKSGLTFQWRKDNVAIPGATSPTYLVTTSGYYRLTATDGSSSCPAVSRNIFITVKPNPPAVITVPGGSLTGCEGDGVKLNANLGGFTYQWNRAGSPVYGLTDSSIIVRVAGTYSVKVITPDGCMTTSAPVTVNILPAPVPVITRSGTLLTATGGAYIAYQWYRNDVAIPGANSATYNITKKGMYKVCVVGTNNCEGCSTPISAMDNELSIDQSSVANGEIRIFPNPTTSIVNIESPVLLNVEVKDVAGRSVMSVTDAKQVDLSKLADGVYMFILRDKEQTVHQQRVTKVSR